MMDVLTMKTSSVISDEHYKHVNKATVSFSSMSILNTAQREPWHLGFNCAWLLLLKYHLLLF